MFYPKRLRKREMSSLENKRAQVLKAMIVFPKRKEKDTFMKNRKSSNSKKICKFIGDNCKINKRKKIYSGNIIKIQTIKKKIYFNMKIV